jgi:hypothetical protein
MNSCSGWITSIASRTGVVKIIPRGKDIVGARVHVKENVLRNEKHFSALNQAKKEPDADREWTVLQETVEGEEPAVCAKGVDTLRNLQPTRGENRSEHLCCQ